VACGVQGHHLGEAIFLFFAQVNCSLFFIAAAARDAVFGQGSPPRRSHFFFCFFQVDCFLFFCAGRGTHVVDVAQVNCCFSFFPPSSTVAGGPTV